MKKSYARIVEKHNASSLDLHVNKVVISKLARMYPQVGSISIRDLLLWLNKHSSEANSIYRMESLEEFESRVIKKVAETVSNHLESMKSIVGDVEIFKEGDYYSLIKLAREIVENDSRK